MEFITKKGKEQTRKKLQTKRNGSGIWRLRKMVSYHKGLHIEAEGCVVNVYEGLHDWEGREVTTVEIIPDDHYSGERKWKLMGRRNNRVVNRVVRLKTVNGGSK